MQVDIYRCVKKLTSVPSESSKLPEREMAVCRRLAEIRDLLSIDQKSLAAILKISRDRLASYENLRAPLRYDIGDRLCAALDLNQRWLATGELPQLQYANFSQAAELIEPRSLFTEAYDTVLKPWILEGLKSVAFLTKHPTEEFDLHLISNNEWKIRHSNIRPAIDPAALLCPLLTSSLLRTFSQLKPELRSKFYRHISRSIIEFLPRHFISLDGVEKGPLSICELQELLARKVLPGSTLVRTDSFPGSRLLTDLIARSNYRSVAQQWTTPPPRLR